MKGSSMTGQRLAATFLLGCVLLNFPILFLFSRETYVWGIPLLYAYVFGVWVLLVAVMALVVERTRD